jgi:hypothetical protein
MVPLKSLTPPERAVRAAFPLGEWVDLRQGRSGPDDPGRAQAWGPERNIRSEVIESLLLGTHGSSQGTAAALRLRGARISGRLNVTGSQLPFAIHFAGCRFDKPPDFAGAKTRTIALMACDLDGFSGRLLNVDGDLLFDSSRVHGCIVLRHSTVSGSIHLNGCRLLTPGQVGLSGGGLIVEGGLFGRHNLVVEGGIRLIGARILGGAFLEGARLNRPGSVALCLDQVTSPVVLCTDGFTANGEVQLRDANIRGLVDFEEAILNSNSTALQCHGMRAGEVRLAPRTIDGLVDLELAQVKTLQDKAIVWPTQLRLDGLTYENLKAESGQNDVATRLAWLQRDDGQYRPQPYEQLAAFYRRIGHDHDARRVLLAKQRARRTTLHPYARAWAYLLDTTVGYGYRPWLAGIWLVFLLCIGTAVFAVSQPRPLNPGHDPHFSAFIYTLDLLVPIGPFGLRNTYSPSGVDQWIAYTLIIAGWILATAVIAGISRVLRRD